MACHRTLSIGRIRAASPALLLTAVALWALACGGEQMVLDPDTRPPADPIGAELYERRMAEASGTELDSARLAELAEAAEVAIEARMDDLALALDTGADWRPAFATIREEHPSTVEDVLTAYREEVAAAATFVAERDWLSLPPELPGVAEAQSAIVRRSFSLALYLNGVLGVITAPGDEPDPSYLANHCRVCIPPLAVHEAYPGHHVAFYHGAIARAGLELGDPVEIRGQPENFYFHEGWGLYSELLMLAAGYYADDPARELAAWRMLLLRATRARVDARLHRSEMTADQAISVYEKELGMARSAAETEVRRHLERPTNKATYFVGLLQIQALARQAREAEPGLTARRFHDRLLARPGPFPRAARDEFGLELAPIARLELEATVF